MDSNVKIKIDFNLLQSGTWVLEKKGNQQIHYFEKKIGEGKIIIYNALDVPSPIDSKILDYLMVRSQEMQWAEEITIPSLRTLAKEIGMGTDKKRLERIRRGLEILVNTRIRFENCFVDNGTLDYIKGGDYEVINIGILTDYTIEKVSKRGQPRQITVWFNKNFISLCKHSLGYKLIPYAPIQGLRDTAYALYKWAYRWYDSSKGYGERWIGSGKALVDWYKNELNSVAQYKYPSEVLRRIKVAIKQLNENPKVPFGLNLKEENGNYKIELYRKEGVILKTKREILFDKLPRALREAIIKLIEKKKHIKDSYALARSMSLKELEILLKKLVVIQLPKSTWEMIETLYSDIRDFEPEDVKKSKIEVIEAPIGKEVKGEFVYLVVEKEKLNEKHSFYKTLEAIIPSWREGLQKAVGYLKEVQLTKL
ncbi:MAG: hypothetical protein ABGX27_09020 [Desulfurobacteriaceae bacterium]